MAVIKRWPLCREVYSQGKSSVPPKMVEPIGSCSFQFHLCTPAYLMSSEFTREVVMKFLPAQFS